MEKTRKAKDNNEMKGQQLTSNHIGERRPRTEVLIFRSLKLENCFEEELILEEINPRNHYLSVTIQLLKDQFLAHIWCSVWMCF